MEGLNADLVPDYGDILENNGISLKDLTFISGSHLHKSKFQDVYVMDNSVESLKCALTQLISASWIVFPLGSPLGFWGTAMRGTKRASVIGTDQIFANLTNSQQGSLWHLRSSFDLRAVFRAVDWLYVCPSNSVDINLFFDILLW
jgi:hypothetical protein